MADTLTTQSSTPATIPENSIIATDDAGAGGHVQVVKLAVSTNGSATPLTADNTDGLLVNLGANNDVVVSDGGNTITVDGTVTANLAAGTNNIGDVDILSIAAGNNNIGDVDVASIAAGDNNIGNVDIVTLPALPAGNNNIGDVDIASIDDNLLESLVDDAAFTPGTSFVLPAGFTFDDVAPDSVDEGDVGAARMSANRNLYTQIRDAAGNERGANVNASNQLSVTGPVTNAGTFAVQIDGNALTSLQLADDVVAVLGTATYTETTTKGTVIGAVRRDADTTLVDTTNEIAPLQVDANGRLKVEAFSGETLPVSLASVPSHAVTNAGTFVTQIDGNALTALQLIDDPVIQDDTAFTPATTKVMMVGLQADETATDSVDEGDAGTPRMTLDRKQIVTVQPHTTGGLTTFMASGSDGSSILVATAQAIKASAGQMYGYYAYNPEAAVTFVHFYNVAAASVTVGTTNPMFTIAIPAGAAANLMFPHGVVFSNAGWSCAATTTAGGNTAPATGVSLVVWYM